MRIDLSEIKHDSGAIKQVDADVNLEDFKFKGRNIEIAEPIHLNLQVTNTEDMYLVTGKMDAKLVFKCDRCLTKFEEAMEIDFIKEFLKEEMESENYLDISDSILEHIILELPMKTICDEECKGLCLICGQDLNEEDCGCERFIPDPRLAKLEEFFDDDKED